MRLNSPSVSALAGDLTKQGWTSRCNNTPSILSIKRQSPWLTLKPIEKAPDLTLVICSHHENSSRPLTTSRCDLAASCLKGLKMLLRFVCIFFPLEMSATHKMMEETLTTGWSCDTRVLIRISWKTIATKKNN